MKIQILIILIFTLSIKLKAQPTGEQKMAKVSFGLINERKDTLQFIKSENSYNSIDKKTNYSVCFYSQNYSLDLNGIEEYNRKFLQLHKKDSTMQYEWKDRFVRDSLVSFNRLTLKNKNTFSFLYFPSIERVDSNKLEPSKDIIILIKKRKDTMKIYLKLYKVKSEFEMGNEVSIFIPFKKGNFEINNSKNPKLIAIKE